MSDAVDVAASADAARLGVTLLSVRVHPPAIRDRRRRFNRAERLPCLRHSDRQRQSECTRPIAAEPVNPTIKTVPGKTVPGSGVDRSRPEPGRFSDKPANHLGDLA